MKNEIKNIIEGLVTSFENDMRKEYFEKGYDSLFNKLDINVKEPDDILKFITKQQHMNKIFFEINISDFKIKDKNKLLIFFNHFDIIYKEVRNLADTGGCCADHTRFILRQYINNMLSLEFDEIVGRDNPGHHYYHPNFGAISDWFKFIDYLNIFLNNLDDINNYIEAKCYLLSLKQIYKKEKEEESLIVNNFHKNFFSEYIKELDSGNITLFEKNKIYYTSKFLYENLEKIKNKDFENKSILLKEFKLFLEENALGERNE